MKPPASMMCLNILHVFAEAKGIDDAGVTFDYDSNLDNIPICA